MSRADLHHWLQQYCRGAYYYYQRIMPAGSEKVVTIQVYLHCQVVWAVLAVFWYEHLPVVLRLQFRAGRGWTKRGWRSPRVFAVAW
jgi:hypothetical protein